MRIENCQYSFGAVSINSGKKTNVSKTAAVINSGFEQINQIQGNNGQTYETLNEHMEKIASYFGKKREEIKAKPWFIPKKGSYKKLDKQEIAQKERLEIKLRQHISDESHKVDSINNIVYGVKKDAADIEHKLFDEKQRRLQNDAMNNLRGRYEINRGFKSIAGYEEEKNILQKYFINEIKKEQEGKPAKVPNSVLFFGPTGNGKTTFAKAFAKETGCNLVPVRIRTIENNKYDVFMENLTKQAQIAEKNFEKTGRRTILFVDEFSKVSDKDSTVLKELNEFMSDCGEKYHCTLFGATNNPLDIKLPLDGEKSVFPYKISMDPPGTKDKAAILEFYLKDRITGDVDYTKLAKRMDKIEDRTKSRYNISQMREHIGMDGYIKPLTEEEVIQKIDSTEPTLKKEQLDKYKEEMRVLMKNTIEE